MKKLLLIGLLASTVLSGAAFAEEKVVPASVPAPPSISVLEAAKRPIKEDLTVTGSFAAGELVLVSPEVEGLAVREILAEVGDKVEQGQVLARLSTESIKIQILQTQAQAAKVAAAVAQAESAIEQSQINANKARDDLNRTKKLRTSGVATVEQFDQRQSAYDLAVAQLNSARLSLEVTKADKLANDAQMADLELRKARSEIKAPVAGFISRRTVQVGGIASGSREPMFNIVANGVMKMMAEVPESDLPKVQVGQKALISVNGFDKPIEGEVKLIDAEVNEATRIGVVHIRVKEGVRVPLGSFGRAVIALAAADGVALPLTAVTFGEDGPTVQVVLDGKVEERKVITGLVSTTEIEITSGLAPGELVVARAGSFVRDGDVVTPVKVDAAQ
jgi:HlyD family secretion protein